MSGLSAAEVDRRVEGRLTNLVTSSSSRSLWDIVQANVLTLFNAIVAGSFVLLLLLGQWRDALFGFAAVSNALIGVVQEYRAKKSLDNLAVLTSPKARVVRDGMVQEVDVEDVVLDDTLVLRAGDQVPADAVVLGETGLEVDESLLTGESDAVQKAAGAEVLSGSSVVTGEGMARVSRVGAQSFASSLTAEAKRFSLVQSEIRQTLNRILRWITFALLPIMAIVINGQMQGMGGWQQAIASGSWKTASVGAVASVIAMIPLGLVLMTSVAFAVGAVRLARKKVLIQELAAVEGLARVDLLCLDKTGTLTVGRIVFDAAHESGAEPPPGWEQVLGWFGADPNANATARCLTSRFPDDGTLHALSSVPFSSARKWSSVSFPDGSPVAGTWLLGAPEIVLAPGTAGADASLSVASRLASTGLRTLVLARATGIAAASGGDDVALPPAPAPAFLPRQLSATDGITIGIPAFFLALMPNARRYHAGFLRRSLSFAVPAGLIIAVAVLCHNAVSRADGPGTGDAVRTGSVLVLALTGLWVLVVLSRPLNGWRALVVGAMYGALALVLTMPPLPEFFDLTPPCSRTADGPVSGRVRRVPRRRTPFPVPPPTAE